MPLVGTNYYGTQVQRTPFDDAEDQRIAAQNAWNMAQQQNNWQNERFGQGRSDAYAMNRDNLNFGVWKEGQADRRDLASVAARERLAKMGFDFETGMFDKRQGAEAARDARLAEREDMLWNTRTKPFQDRTLAGLDLQAAEAKAQAEERERKRKQAEDLRKFLSTPEGLAAVKAGNVDAFAGMADPDFLLSRLFEREARTRATQEAKRERLATELQGTDPTKRSRAKKQILANPDLRDTIDIEAGGDPIRFDPANIAHRDAADAINRELQEGMVGQVMQSLSRNRSPDPDDPQLRSLADAIETAAGTIAESTGVDARSVREHMIRQLAARDLQGGGLTAQRIIGGILSLGGTEIADNRSEQQMAVDKALTMFGLKAPE